MDLAPDKTVREIISRPATIGEGVVRVEGTWGSFARLLAAHISKSTSRPILYVCAHIDDAEKLGICCDELWPRVERLIDLVVIRHIGASLDSRKLGNHSTLAAIQAGCQV